MFSERVLILQTPAPYGRCALDRQKLRYTGYKSDGFARLVCVIHQHAVRMSKKCIVRKHVLHHWLKVLDMCYF